MGGYYWGKTDEEELTATVCAAVDSGITLIDTADSYGWGRSEELLGKALAGRRHEVILTSKVGQVRDTNQQFGRTELVEMEEHIRHDLTRKHVLEAVEGSLRRLRTDYLDLYLLHWPDESTPIEESLGAMEALVDAGKVRAVGVSNFDEGLLAEARGVYPVACNQVQLSMLVRGEQAGLVAACRRAGLSVVAYWVLHKGLLTGKYGAKDAFPRDDWRHYDPDFRGRMFRRRVEAVGKLKAVAADLGVTMSQLALAWVVAQPGVTAALAGAERLEQARQNAGADIELDAATLETIDAIMADVQA